MDADIKNEATEEQQVEWENDSSTLNNDDADERKRCWAGAMENANARKAAKAERKAAKNQVRFNVITKEDLDNVLEVLHPDVKHEPDRSLAIQAEVGQGLTGNTTIDDNITFNPHTFMWGTLRQGIHDKKIAKANGGRQIPDAQRLEHILTRVLNGLGIKTDLAKATKERRNLETKLRNAITRDLEAFENEQAETMQRMAGYWRYVNRRTYNQMVKNNELWDWATGQKLPEIEEETELDVIEEEDESLEEGALDGPTPVGTPPKGPLSEDYDDGDFELPAGQTSFTPVVLTDRSLDDSQAKEIKTPTKSFSTDTRSEVDIETARNCIERLNLPRLSFSPGRSPGPTLTFSVPSPSPSDDDYIGDWKEPHTALEGRHLTNIDLRTFQEQPPFVSTPIKAPVKETFEGVKDTRILFKAIRPASPPAEDRTPMPRVLQVTTNLKTTVMSQASPVLNNRFGVLNNNTPAPKDEVKKPEEIFAKKTVIRIPAKPIVKVISTSNDPGWEMKPVKARKKAPLQSGLRKQAAVNNHAKKIPAGKSFADAIKKGL